MVTNSDIESLSIDDNQLDILMNKSDLSDIDQLDTRTITGSCSSDEADMEEAGVWRAGSAGSGPRAAATGPRADTGDQAEQCEGQDPRAGQDSPDQVSSGAAASGGPRSRPGQLRGGGRSPVCGQTRRGAEVHGEQLRDVATPPAATGATAVSATAEPSASASPGLQGRLPAGAQLSFSSLDNVGAAVPGQPPLAKRKGSVSDLIARFEASSRSTTPERSLTPVHCATPDTTAATRHPPASTPPSGAAAECINEEKTKIKDTGARPKVPSNKNQADKKDPVAVSNTNEPNAPNESLIANESNESERAELRGLKEFTQKYLKEQQARNGVSGGDEAACESEGEDLDLEDPDMPPTIRRNSGGAYTSYVFISSDPSNDDVASVVSSNGSYKEDRVTVNSKEHAVSPNTCVVSIQDGRTSNISIVSTESSELNSPRQSPVTVGQDSEAGLPPELPTKVKVGGKSHSELQQIVYATRESLRDFSHRSRGGETADFDRDFQDEELSRERSG